MQWVSCKRVLAGILCLCVFEQACAEDANSPIVEDVLDATLEFDMPVVDNAPDPGETVAPGEPEIFGKDLRFSFGYQLGTQFDDLSEIVSNRFDARLRWERLLRQSVYASVDGKLILRLPNDQQLDSGEDVRLDWRLRDLSLQGNMSSLSIKAGYQAVIWGEMDSVPINDVMTPWDYSEFAFTAPEDARVSQPIILVDWFKKQTRLSAVFNPYPLANRFPGGEAKDLLEEMLGTGQFHVNEDFPRLGKDYEIGMRLKHTRGPSDIGLYVARVLSDFPRFDQGPDHSDGNPTFDIRYPRYELAGVSANYGQGNFLWKFEAAFKNNVYFPLSTPVFRDTFESAAGVDYNANGAYDLTVELHNQHILSGPGTLTGYKTNNSQAIARWSKNFRHETVSTVYYISYQLQYGDITHSAAVQYAVSDYWRIEFNATVFEIQNEDSPMRFVDDWDQLTVTVRLDI